MGCHERLYFYCQNYCNALEIFPVTVNTGADTAAGVRINVIKRGLTG